MKSLVNLFRLYNPTTGSYLYTTNSAEAVQATGSDSGYRFEGSPGQVATQDECGCGLQPIYRVYKNAKPKDDRVLTNDAAEADKLAASGYSKEPTKEGIAFYASQVNGRCGASLALRRYTRGSAHFYTASEAEANKNVVPKGGKAEGILAYIWPKPATDGSDDAAAQLKQVKK